MIIKYYRKAIYGEMREYIHQDCQAQREIVSQLTRMSTVTPLIRDLISRLSNNHITWTEVLAPN